MKNSKHITATIRLAEFAQRFFAPSAAQEILGTFLPMFSIDSIKDAFKAQGYLVLFLPVSVPRHSVTNEILSDSDNMNTTAMHPKDYLPTLFSLWSLITSSSTYDGQFIAQIGHIAEANISDPYTADVGVFKHEQIKAVFSAGLQMMNIPVGSRDDSGTVGGRRGGSTGYGNNSRKYDIKAGDALLLRSRFERYKSLARFIVYTIIPEDGGSNSYVMSLLEDLVQATELYYHPSNYGLWSFYLTIFTHHLSEGFLRRWKEEEDPDCKTPPERRLTLEMRKRFVLTIRPLTYLSIFAKDSFIVRTTQKTLKYLCWLEPQLIFPGILERIYPSLETLTETHRTMSVLGFLAETSMPFLTFDHYPAGGKHLVPLLDLATPGIDMNDPIKSVIAMLFINSAVSMVPIRDLTKEPTGYNDGGYNHGIQYQGMELDGSGHGYYLSREEEERLCKTSTALFEDWVAKFLRRIFALLENLPQHHQKRLDGAYETGLTSMAIHTCETLFSQLSDEMYDMALRMIVDNVSQQVLSNAIYAGGFLCSTIAKANPSKAAKLLIPLCIRNIMTEIEHGASSTIANAAGSTPIQSDSTLHWYQGILFSTVSVMGPELLKYKNDIIGVLKVMNEKCKNRKGFMWAGKLLRSALKTLLATYPYDFRSLTPSNWKDPGYMQNSNLVWGKPGDPKNLEIDWHVPSTEEIEFAMELLETFLVPSMQNIREMIKGDLCQLGLKNTHEVTNNFCRHFAIIRNALLGTTCMIPCTGFEPISDDEKLTRFMSTAFEAGYALHDPSHPVYARARLLRREIVQLTHESIQFFQRERENDLESLKILIKIAKTLLDDIGIDKKDIDAQSARYTIIKTIYKTPLKRKHYPRGVLVYREYLLHLRRLRINAKLQITNSTLNLSLLRDLLDLSLSSYAEIRKLSQSTLNAALRNYIGGKSLIIPTILDALEPKQGEKAACSNQMKGALYLLQHKSILNTCIHKPELTPRFVLSICKAHHEDKPSIQELIRKVFLNFIHSAATASAFSRALVPKETKDYIDLLGKSDEIQNISQMYQGHVDSWNQKRWTAYDKIMDALLNLVEDPKLHWRFSTMAANVIQVFLRPERPPSNRLAIFATKSTLSELSPMRRIGVAITTQLLQYIEDRTLAAGDDTKLILRNGDDPLECEVQNRSLCAEKYLMTMDTKLTEESLNDCPFIDESSTGWYVWADKIHGRVVRSSEVNDRDIDPASRAGYDELAKSFTTASYWTRLLAYMSQELSQAEADVFNRVNVDMYENIFIIFEDKPICALMDDLVRLCQATDQRSHQRAAAELIAGLIRGTINWPLNKTLKLWEWLSPLLQSTFSAITPDSLTYWEAAVKHCACNWDPRRLQPLTSIIFGATFDPNSDAAFAEGRKLLLTRALIGELGWRSVSAATETLLDTYLAHIAHPYKQVREALGSNINEILQFQWAPSMANVKKALEFNQQNKHGGVGNVPNTLSEKNQTRLDTVLEKLDNLQIHDVDAYRKASKTVLCWLHDALGQYRVGCVSSYIIPLWKRVVFMQEVHEDPDLQEMASSILTSVMQFPYPPTIAEKLMDEVIHVLERSESWRIRSRMLSMLQVFFFRNLFNMKSEQIVHVMSTVSSLLLDTQIEVRQMAATTLGGLVRCSQREAIARVRAEYSELLKTKISKRRRDPKTGKVVEIPGFDEAVLKKHAGVLGLSCLVSAFPYEVPDWMPEILCQLAGCMSDPAEIQSTVRKTFSDFRRTHSDTWHEDIIHFTDDQLSILNDMLISPSYYA
ncbi:hypothetical protein BX666DRAFT_1850314 [Dichotomocladium elegans]|nr:hypothetical protein BX666DRAFT_1850314 [Dichotomocladium elegans]